MEKIERQNVIKNPPKDHKNLAQFESNGELMDLIFEWRDLRLTFQETGDHNLEAEADMLRSTIIQNYDISLYDLVRLAKMGE